MRDVSSRGLMWGLIISVAGLIVYIGLMRFAFDLRGRADGDVGAVLQRIEDVEGVSLSDGGGVRGDSQRVRLEQAVSESGIVQVVSGQVLDRKSGQPLSGVRLSIRLGYADRRKEIGRAIRIPSQFTYLDDFGREAYMVVGPIAPLVSVIGDGLGLLATAMTDGRGGFAVEVNPDVKGCVFAEVRAPSGTYADLYWPFQLSGDDVELRLAMDARRTVRGEVRCEATESLPEGAKLLLIAASGTHAWGANLEMGGAFEGVVGSPAVIPMLVASGSWRLRSPVPSVSPGVDVTLWAEKRPWFHVSSASTGKPVVDCHVEAWGPRGFRVSDMSSHDRLGRHGLGDLDREKVFMMTNLNLLVCADGYRSEWVRQVGLRGRSPVAKVMLKDGGDPCLRIGLSASLQELMIDKDVRVSVRRTGAPFAPQSRISSAPVVATVSLNDGEGEVVLPSGTYSVSLDLDGDGYSDVYESVVMQDSLRLVLGERSTASVQIIVRPGSVNLISDIRVVDLETDWSYLAKKSGNNYLVNAIAPGNYAIWYETVGSELERQQAILGGRRILLHLSRGVNVVKLDPDSTAPTREFLKVRVVRESGGLGIPSIRVLVGDREVWTDSSGIATIASHASSHVVVDGGHRIDVHWRLPIDLPEKIDLLMPTLDSERILEVRSLHEKIIEVRVARLDLECTWTARELGGESWALPLTKNRKHRLVAEGESGAVWRLDDLDILGDSSAWMLVRPKPAGGRVRVKVLDPKGTPPYRYELFVLRRSGRCNYSDVFGRNIVRSGQLATLSCPREEGLKLRVRRLGLSGEEERLVPLSADWVNSTADFVVQW